MALQLLDLDGRTRDLMTIEAAADEEQGTLYLSPRLNEGGRLRYPGLLRDAIAGGDDETLAAELRRTSSIRATEQARAPRGGITTRRVPASAATTLAEGEFNRFYLRGLSLRALADGIEQLEIYRARTSASPRPESLLLEGTAIGPAGLLADLRQHPGADTALGLPPGPNSGLSARLPSAPV